VIVSGVVTISVVITGSLAGFAFAKLRFRGRNILLLSIIVTMMIPTQLGLIPLWGMIQDLGWYDTLLAVTVPFLVSAFGVFMMRQYATQAISDELIEAGRVDGASTFRIFWNIVLPALRPAAAVLGLLTFMETWNSYLWPYAVLTPENPTLQVSLAFLSYAYYTDYSQVFAATAIGTVPLVIVFALFGRQIIGGIMEGAVKS
jgi:cellobiose transport system permease protein